MIRAAWSYNLKLLYPCNTCKHETFANYVHIQIKLYPLRAWAPRIAKSRATLHPLPGDHSVVAPPVPIPNTEVKRNRADGSVILSCESRSSPGSLSYKPSVEKQRVFFDLSVSLMTIFLGLIFNLFFKNYIQKISIDMIAFSFNFAIMLQSFMVCIAMIFV